MNKPVVLYGPNNQVIDKSSVFNLDPGFFKGMRGSGSGFSLSKALRQPYSNHVWVYACAHVIALNLSRLPHMLIETTGSGEEEKAIYKHDILTLLDKPNKYQTKTQFWEAVVLGLMLPTTKSPGGQVFIIPNDKTGQNVDLSRGQLPAELYALTDETVDAEVKNGEIVGWKFRVHDSQEYRRFTMNELIRIYLYNPYSAKHGMSPFSAAQVAFGLDMKADLYNWKFFDNNGTVGGTLTSDQAITQAQRQEMLRAWMETYGGSQNAGGIAVLGHGLTYEQFQKSHLDMQWKEQKEFNRDEIFAAYGINELAFGRLESIPYANVKEGQKVLWNDTYLPIQETIWESINASWINFYKPEGRLFGQSDLSQVGALKGDMKSQVEIAATMVQKMNVPPAEAMRVLEIPVDLEKYPHLESVYINPMLIDVTDPDAETGTDTDDDGKDKKAIKKDVDEEEDIDQVREMEYMLVDQYIKFALTPLEKEMRNMFFSFFIKQRNEMQDKVDAWIREVGDQPLSEETIENAVKKTVFVSPNQFLLDLVEQNKLLQKLYEPYVTKQMKIDTAKLETELDGLVQWNVSPEIAADIFSTRKTFISGINITTMKKTRLAIERVVMEGIQNNLTTKQVARDIKGVIRKVSSGRQNNAMTIARTEIGTISAQTRFKAFEAEGIKYHKWLTARDDKVRVEPFNHKDEHGNIVEVGNPFPLTGLVYPRAPGGEAGNVISCRCTTIAAEPPKKPKT